MTSVTPEELVAEFKKKGYFDSVRKRLLDSFANSDQGIEFQQKLRQLAENANTTDRGSLVAILTSSSVFNEVSTNLSSVFDSQIKDDITRDLKRTYEEMQNPPPIIEERKSQSINQSEHTPKKSALAIQNDKSDNNLSSNSFKNKGVSVVNTTQNIETTNAQVANLIESRTEPITNGTTTEQIQKSINESMADTSVTGMVLDTESISEEDIQSSINDQVQSSIPGSANWSESNERDLTERPSNLTVESGDADVEMADSNNRTTYDSDSHVDASLNTTPKAVKTSVNTANHKMDLQLLIENENDTDSKMESTQDSSSPNTSLELVDPETLPMRTGTPDQATHQISSSQPSSSFRSDPASDISQLLSELKDDDDELSDLDIIQDPHLMVMESKKPKKPLSKSRKAVKRKSLNDTIEEEGSQKYKTGMILAALVPIGSHQDWLQAEIIGYDSSTMMYTVRDIAPEDDSDDEEEQPSPKQWDIPENKMVDHTIRTGYESLAVDETVWALYKDKDLGMLTAFYAASIESINRSKEIVTVNYGDGDTGLISYTEMFRNSEIKH
ncbi:hypothetical protein BC833DRAFT_256191 [Globomyces pollinis-pini]|nr:hypothetical protein BC833DRAFT_256191 [Globomyces pollinis-pini]